MELELQVCFTFFKYNDCHDLAWFIAFSMEKIHIFYHEL